MYKAKRIYIHIHAYTHTIYGARAAYNGSVNYWLM